MGVTASIDLLCDPTYAIRTAPVSNKSPPDDDIVDCGYLIEIVCTSAPSSMLQTPSSLESEGQQCIGKPSPLTAGKSYTLAFENDGCVSHINLYVSIASGAVGVDSPPAHPEGNTLNPLISNSCADHAKRNRSAVSESDATDKDTSVRKPGNVPLGIAYEGSVEIALE